MMSHNEIHPTVWPLGQSQRVKSYFSAWGRPREVLLVLVRITLLPAERCFAIDPYDIARKKWPFFADGLIIQFQQFGPVISDFNLNENIKWQLH